MKKWIILIILTLCMVQIVTAAAECQISTDNSTWSDVESTRWGGCIDDTAKLSFSQNLESDTLYYVRCKDTGYDWGYQSFKTKEGGSKKEMGSLAIMIFVLAITGTLFVLPMIRRFSRFEITNLILSRGCWIIAIYLMMLNSAIAATISKTFSLGLENEMFRYMWLFGVLGYVLMGFMVLRTLIDVLNLWKLKKEKRRFGDEEED